MRFFPENFLIFTEIPDNCKIPRHFQVFPTSGHHGTGRRQQYIENVCRQILLAGRRRHDTGTSAIGHGEQETMC